jgi:hypothetical protein
LYVLFTQLARPSTSREMGPEFIAQALSKTRSTFV